MVWEVKDPMIRKWCRFWLSSPNLIHHITAKIYLKYCSADVKQQKQKNASQYLASLITGHHHHINSE